VIGRLDDYHKTGIRMSPPLMAMAYDQRQGEKINPPAPPIHGSLITEGGDAEKW